MMQKQFQLPRSKFCVALWFVLFLGYEKGLLLMSLFLSQCDSGVLHATPFHSSVKCGAAVTVSLSL